MNRIYTIILLFIFQFLAYSAIGQTEQQLIQSVGIAVNPPSGPSGTVFVVGDKLLMTALHVANAMTNTTFTLSLNGVTADVEFEVFSIQFDGSDWAFIRLLGANANLFTFTPLNIAGYNLTVPSNVFTLGGLQLDYAEGTLVDDQNNFLITSGIDCFPGTSGSPLVDDGGNVIGILSLNFGNDDDCGWINLTDYSAILTGFEDLNVLPVYIQTNILNDYRSISNGLWSVPGTWERFDGTDFIPAAAPPSSLDNRITISSGTEVTINSPVTADQLTIQEEAVLIQNSGLNIVNGNGDDLIINGTININSSCSLSGAIKDNGLINWMSGNISFNGANLNISEFGILKISGSGNMDNTLMSNNIFCTGTLQIENSIIASTIDITFINTGTIKGSGTIDFTNDFLNNGTISPGFNIDINTLDFKSTSIFLGSNILQIEIDNNGGPGIGNDLLKITGDLDLDGQLMISEINTVPFGIYTIIEVTGGTINGNFSNVTMPLGYTLIINGDNVQIEKGEIDFGPEKPGSGKSIVLDGSSSVMIIPHEPNISFAPTEPFTIEMWVKIPPTQQPNSDKFYHFLASKISNNVINYSILMLGTPFDSDAGKIGFLQQNVDGFASVVSTSKVNDNKPHHISFQYSGSSLRCYIDGILEAESTEINATSTQNTNPIIFGGVLENEFFGNCKYELDEFRIWNIALSDQQVKERVCKKIKETDLLIDNLQAYYKLDEDSGSIIKDYTTHNNFGNNFGANRKNSVFPIGDESAFDYINTTKNTSISHPNGDNFTVEISSGDPSGLQSYMVHGQPNSIDGIQGLGGNDKYFGVFVIGGNSPQYSADYQYNPNLGNNEEDFRLHKRTNNSEITWTALIDDQPNTIIHTISVIGQNTEYILGSIGTPLPLKIIAFNAEGHNLDVHLNWKIVEFENIKYCEVERSIDGKNFESIAHLSKLNYEMSYLDKEILTNQKSSYYRLSFYEKNGRKEYSKIEFVQNLAHKAVNCFPNPTSGILNLSGTEVKSKLSLYNGFGVLIETMNGRDGMTQFSLTNIPAGIYLIKYESRGEVQNFRVVKK